MEASSGGSPEGLWEKASWRRYPGGIKEEASWRRRHRGGIIGEASWSRHHRGGIVEEASWRRHPGEGIMENALGAMWRHLGSTSGGIWEAPGSIWEASGRHLGSIWRHLRGVWEGSGRGQGGSGASGHLGGKSNKNHCLSSRPPFSCESGAPDHHGCMYFASCSRGRDHLQSPHTLHPASKTIRQNPYRETSVWGMMALSLTAPYTHTW